MKAVQYALVLLSFLSIMEMSYASSKQAPKAKKQDVAQKAKGKAKVGTVAKKVDSDDEMLDKILADPQHQKQMLEAGEMKVDLKYVALSSSELENYAKIHNYVLNQQLDELKKFVNSTKNGVDLLKRVNAQGQSLLFVAIEKNDPQMLKFLLDKKVDVNLPELQGVTPLMFVATKNNPILTDILLSQPGINIDAIANKKETALLYAIENHNRDMVEKLIAKGVDPNIKMTDGDSALLSSLDKDFLDITNLLLNYKKTNIDIQNNEGQTALILAIQQGNEDLVRKILEKGANPNIVDNKGNNALRMASDLGDVTIFNILLQSKKIDLSDKNLFSLLISTNNSKIMQILLGKGISPQIGSQSALVENLKNNNYQIVDMLLDNSLTDINCKNKQGETPLMFASALGKLSIVRKLLEKGAIINDVDEKGNSSLIYTILSYNQSHMTFKDREAIIRLLINSGAENIPNDKDETPISLAQELSQDFGDFVKKCFDQKDQADALRQKSDKNIMQHSYDTWKKNTDLHVPQKTAEVMTQTDYSDNPVVATQTDVADNSATIKSLVHASVQTDSEEVSVAGDNDARSFQKPRKPKDLSLDEALDLEAMRRKRALAAKVISQTEEKEGSDRDQLLNAIKRNDLAACKKLLSHDIDLELKNKALLLAVIGNKTEICRLLLSQKDINFNVKDSHGDTIFIIAASRGYDQIVRLLLGYGIDINQQGFNGNTALFAAIVNQQGKIIRIILNHKDCNINVTNNAGDTAFIIAVRNGNADAVEMLLPHKDLRINEQNHNREFALIEAVQNRYLNILKMLLSHESCNVNLKDARGDTALIAAIKNEIESIDIIKMLLARKDININEQNHNGRSALIEATINGRFHIVKMLLEHRDIGINIKDDMGNTALMYAVELQNQPIIKLMIEKGAQNIANNAGETPVQRAREIFQGLGFFVEKHLMANNSTSSREEIMNPVAKHTSPPPSYSIGETIQPVAQVVRKPVEKEKTSLHVDGEIKEPVLQEKQLARGPDSQLPSTPGVDINASLAQVEVSAAKAQKDGSVAIPTDWPPLVADWAEDWDEDKWLADRNPVAKHTSPPPTYEETMAGRMRSRFLR